MLKYQNIENFIRRRNRIYRPRLIVHPRKFIYPVYTDTDFVMMNDISYKINKFVEYLNKYAQRIIIKYNDKSLDVKTKNKSLPFGNYTISNIMNQMNNMSNIRINLLQLYDDKGNLIYEYKY